MPAPIIVPLLIKAAVWITTVGAAAYGVKKVTEAFGSTPANDLSNAGIPRDKQYAAALEAQKDKKAFFDKLNEERKKENDELKAEIEKLKKKLLKQTEDWNNESDPGEKARKLAIMKETENQIKSLEEKVNKNDATINENNKKIEGAFNSIGNPSTLTEGQFNDRGNSINWTSYKNWGIIFFCVIVMIMLIAFIKKMLSQFASSLK